MRSYRPSPITVPSPRLSYETIRANPEIITKVKDGLFIGTINSVNKNILDMYHIGAVVSIQNIPIEINRKIPVLRVNIKDSQDENVEDLLDTVSDFIELYRRSGENVLIHCTAGISRSPTFLIGYLMKYEHMDPIEAFNFVKSKRSCTSPNTSFLLQLKHWQH